MRVGVCCPGGGGAGIAQVGMLKALKNVSVISGASVGAINAAMFAQGSLKELEELWLKVSQKDVFKLGRPFYKTPLNNQPLFDLLDKHIDQQKLIASDIKCFVAATDFETGTAVWADNFDSKFIDKLKGSVSIPIVFKEHAGLWDGAIVESQLTRPLVYYNCDVVFILHTRPKVVYGDSLISKALRAFHQVYYQNTIRPSNIEFIDIYPKIKTGILEFNPKNARERIEDGYQQALSALSC